MKLIKAHYEIMTPINGEEILKQIELAARTCYKSEDKIEYEPLSIPDIEGDKYIGDKEVPDYYAKSARILIPKLITRGHEAMLEFGGMITVKFICDRGVSHELVRHRLASFAQESTRYCNYSKDEHISFIIPSWINLPEKEYVGIMENNHLCCSDFSGLTNDINAHAWFWHCLHSERIYNNLIMNNLTPQQARSILPNSLKTEINVSANIREWRHILKLRCSNAAHPDMQYLMRPLLNEFKQRIPILFDNIVY